MQALQEFIYMAQSLLFYNEHLSSLEVAHWEFHITKSTIYNAGGWLGKHGPINHWNIPKLELMSAIHQSIIWMGVPYQWTSDITECCHITHVKTLYHLSNHRNFYEQCCRYMDHIEKCLNFKMYTTSKTIRPSLVTEMANEASQITGHLPELVELSEWVPESNTGTALAAPSSLFTKHWSHITDDQTTAFTVSMKPHFTNVPVDTIINAFKLSNFQATLGDFFVLKKSYTDHHGKRKSGCNCPLPFKGVHMWKSFHMQQCSAQDSWITLPVRTVQALPPSHELPFGHENTVMVSKVDGVGGMY